jgi:hypothetical protein
MAGGGGRGGGDPPKTMPQCPRHGCDCVIVFVCVYHGSRKRCGPQYNAVSSMIVAVFLMCSECVPNVFLYTYRQCCQPHDSGCVCAYYCRT